ncbi:hypothetical protein Tamer19_64840 [Cupriavidus sp. TA19]|uniref:DUF3106 domain-containing protein n=1 Tax=unclassified Cupriavidus TaxID=2640874 RepID=UPI000E2F86CB|nr:MULTISPECIES: DUF3106 domain-containing protein [unclassified Cupriavidus]BDB23569.1 DUF3106 domain-containing protein [Cupriavidus sp. P-10]GLC97075.1 hypothetical protein Tamer19_64840 [Cupriavidus sp. TA19]
MAPALSRPDALRRRLAALLLAMSGAATGWCLLPAAAHAQAASGASAAASARPAWSELSPVNQRILAPLQPLWDTLPELNRRKWLRIAERYPKFSPAEQARLQTRMDEWVKMTPQQRRLARENYQITRALPAEKKAEAWDKYQALPEEQKKKLAAAERVPSRPGAVSALPSTKRLPGSTSHAVRHEPKAGGAGGAAGKPASEVQAASAAVAPATAAASSAPAAVSATVPTPATTPAATPPAATSTAPAAPEPATEAAAASEGTARQ